MKMPISKSPDIIFESKKKYTNLINDIREECN